MRRNICSIPSSPPPARQKGRKDTQKTATTQSPIVTSRATLKDGEGRDAAEEEEEDEEEEGEG